MATANKVLVDRVGRPSRVDLIAVAIIAVAGLVLGFGAKTVPTFPYDADGYWNLSQTMWSGGHWSLYGLTDVNRGYVPVVSFGALHSVGDHLGFEGRDVVRVLNALIFGVLGGALLPRLAMMAWPNRVFGVGHRVLVGAALLIFWTGYLAYPLTDFLAPLYAIVAILLAGRNRSLPWFVVAGVAVGIAVNLRPAYVLVLFGVIVLSVASAGGLRDGRWRRSAVAAGALIAGAILVSAPQFAINRHVFHSGSPFPGAGAHLGTFQLTAGLQVQLYGTNVADDSSHPAMKYLDPAGTKLIAPDDYAPPAGLLLKGSGTYVHIALRHPVGMAAVMFRHVVNGLDQRYSSPYPSVLDTGQRRPFRLAGFVLLFLALLRLCWPAARRSLGKTRLAPIGVLLLAVVTSIPAAMEQRFMLPVFMLAVLLVAAPGWREAIASTSRPRRPWVALAVVVALGAFLFATTEITRSTTSHLRMDPVG